MAAKTRINVMFDEKTLRLADREARRREISRSEFIRGAIRSAAEHDQRAAEEAALCKRRLKAVAGMNRMARKFGDWPAEEILRAARDRWSVPKKG
jgi:metal-responsive CopG/Arc/MetJ family transcriptional regulator